MMSRVSCQKGPTRHAYAWQIGPFWQDTLDVACANMWTAWVIINCFRPKCNFRIWIITLQTVGKMCPCLCCVHNIVSLMPLWLICHQSIMHWQHNLIKHHQIPRKHPFLSTVKWVNFGRWGNFGHYKTFVLSNIFCQLKNNLVVNMEVKDYLWSGICFKRSFIRLDPIMS